MAAPRATESSWRICRRYKIFFYICTIICTIQLLLGLNFYRIQSINTISKDDRQGNEMGHLSDSPSVSNLAPRLAEKNVIKLVTDAATNLTLTSCKHPKVKEALSAITRAKSETCKLEIAKVACLNEENKLYPLTLPRYCPIKGKHLYGTFLGCHKDDQKDRDMVNFTTQFQSDNSPETCLKFCLNGGYQYAGVQYKTECWCGHTYGKHGKLPDTSCSAVCPGNITDTCGGYNAQRIFSTGLPKKRMHEARMITSEREAGNVTRVRIVFVLTVNGRAVRQVRRLINTLYDPAHFFYIHVDSRSSYMYRELLPLEHLLPNVRLSRARFATIWGGASLLQAHLTFIKDLLGMLDWSWDYYINLSETDYPIKTVQQLTWFISSQRGKNFLKSSGRETPIFIKKQGLTELFHECDNHLWRLGKRPLQVGISYDGGSDWIGLYREFAQYAAMSSDPLVTGLKESYKYSLLPVESFFHTLLLNSKFCDTMVDNNLHLTNWKRKQGCKCQHKNQVDWCGCSPSVFKPEDLGRLKNYMFKPVYFARKFEPIICQEILNFLDESLHIDLNEVAGLIHYWQNDFHHLDPRAGRTDLWLTFLHSLTRRTRHIMNSTYPACMLGNLQLLESHVLNVADRFNRYLVKFNATVPGVKHAVTFESAYSFRPHYRIVNPVGPIGRLQFLEIGSEFDLKELIFRNYPKFLGPDSDVRLRYVFRNGPGFAVSIAWVDPAGTVAAYNDINIGPESLMDSQNPKLKTPLRPGIWTVKILYKLNVCAEVQFLVLPYSVLQGAALTQEQVITLHNGPQGLYSHTNYTDMASILNITDSKNKSAQAVINGKKTGAALEDWIDGLSMEFWSVQDACHTENLPNKCPPLEMCSETQWSSLSPDPKTELSKDVLKYAKHVSRRLG